MIVVPLNPDFQFKSAEDQHSIVAALQICARQAGLAGSGSRVGFGRRPHGLHRASAMASILSEP